MFCSFETTFAQDVLGLDEIKAKLEQIQQEVDNQKTLANSESVTDTELAAAKVSLIKFSQDAFQTALDTSAQLAKIDTQISELGPAPEDGACRRINCCLYIQATAVGCKGTNFAACYGKRKRFRYKSRVLMKPLQETEAEFSLSKSLRATQCQRKSGMRLPTVSHPKPGVYIIRSSTGFACFVKTLSARPFPQ